MNDKSNRIFTYIKQQVQAKYPKCFCTTANVSSSDVQLPALYVQFAFPSEDETSIDSSGVELWTRTTCTAESYSGTSAQEAKGILAIADAAMKKCGFSRSNYTEVPNAADATVRRFSATWRGKVNADGVVARW